MDHFHGPLNQHSVSLTLFSISKYWRGDHDRSFFNFEFKMKKSIDQWLNWSLFKFWIGIQAWPNCPIDLAIYFGWIEKVQKHFNRKFRVTKIFSILSNLKFPLENMFEKLKHKFIIHFNFHIYLHHKSISICADNFKTILPWSLFPSGSIWNHDHILWS